MAGYTKEFLIDVAISRFEILGVESAENMRPMFEIHYNKVGKEEFRKHASIDAETIRNYKDKW